MSTFEVQVESAVVRAAVNAVWRRACALSGIKQDVLLYIASAVFAGGTSFIAVSADYRFWGACAGVAYLLGAGVCAFASRRGDECRHLRVRGAVILFLLLGAVLVPLVTELTWRADARPGANAQPEVAVIERAGVRLAHGRSPYLTNPTSVGVSPSSDRPQVDSTAFFPYLPGMAPFGLNNAAPGPPELRDARVLLAGFTLLVGALTLAYPGAAISRRARVFQFLIVLPSGALPMVTGGDDLPVLAVMLVALVLAQRRRPVLSGLAIGLAATLKFTSWPLLALLFFAVHDREGRRAPIRYGLSALIVACPVIGAGIAASPGGFVTNVIRFPLGLAKIKSPAASPLLGQVLVNVLPHEKRVVTMALLFVGAAIVLGALRRWPPRTAGGVARFTAFAMCVATVLAPATRFGYLIYPANLVVWGWLLDAMPIGTLSDDQLASSISYSVKDTVLVGVGADPPASSGEIDGPEDFTTSPTPQ